MNSRKSNNIATNLKLLALNVTLKRDFPASMQKRSQILSKFFQNPHNFFKKCPKILPKWKQNPPKSLSETPWGPPYQKGCQKTPPGSALDPPKSPQRLPKPSQNRSKIDQTSLRKSNWKLISFLKRFVCELWPQMLNFGIILGGFFASKTLYSSKPRFLKNRALVQARALKITLFQSKSHENSLQNRFRSV